MDLAKITDVSRQLGLSSRSLRYYEQVGLLCSVRPPFEKYRYYDADNIERLRQIIVLRKMQIPIKDIIRIYESEDMSVLVEAFVQKIHALDGEIAALSEMKRITNDFLQAMTKQGISKISALPLLYEEMDRQLELIGPSAQDAGRSTASFDKLSALNERLEGPPDISIVDLPPMRVLSSYPKDNLRATDTEGFSRYVQAKELMPATSGNHEFFELQRNGEDVAILRVPDGFVNDSVYMDLAFEGGLFAAANVYLDEDLAARFRVVLGAFDGNPYYQIDYSPDGDLRHPAMLEAMISPDSQRELVSLYVPVKQRLADVGLFGKPKELEPGTVTAQEIERQNPILWEIDVPLDKLRPINKPHYRVLETGEAEYTGWISTRVLSTEVKVKLPFRVDIEFRLNEKDEWFGYGDTEGSMVVYHGDDMGYFAGGNMGQMGFGINTGNHASSDAWVSAPMRQEALSFRQPIFRDLYHFPGRGGIDPIGYNRVTWIVGARHLATIVNGELRYCGVNFPYMALDLSREEARPIVIGANGQGKKTIRSICVSQLELPQKNRDKGGLNVITKRSNNAIPIIHRLITDELGENYWFNGCAKYVMESLGEKDYDYQFFAGITGDVFAQFYPAGEFQGEGPSSYFLHFDTGNYFEKIFGKCGYAATFVPKKDLLKNTEMYRQTVVAYIDKGVPVISWGRSVPRYEAPVYGVIVGYEDYGKALLYITGNSNEPMRVPLEDAMEGELDSSGWVFVGEKKESRALAAIYREALAELPVLMISKEQYGSFGAHALRAWASDIENGRYAGVDPVRIDFWDIHTCYVCGLATNGSCCHEFLKRARELNPDMEYLEEISGLYRRTAQIWNDDDGKDLEALGGGFNITVEVLRDKEKCARIAGRIRECADIMERVVEMLTGHLRK